MEQVWTEFEQRKIIFGHPLPQSHGGWVIKVNEKLQYLGDRLMRVTEELQLLGDRLMRVTEELQSNFHRPMRVTET